MWLAEVSSAHAQRAAMMRELCGRAPAGNRAFQQCCQHSDFVPVLKPSQAVRSSRNSSSEQQSEAEQRCSALRVHSAHRTCAKAPLADLYVNFSLSKIDHCTKHTFFKSPMTLFSSPTMFITAKCTSPVMQFR